MAPQAQQPEPPVPLRAGSGAVRLALAALLAVLVVAGFARTRLLLDSSPYVLHEDELIATRRASRMLDTGDWDPRFFRYPSLTIYLTAASIGVGHLIQGESVAAETGELEPTYERPEIGLSGRFLMIGLSLLCMVFVGCIARRVFDSPSMLWLAPLMTLISVRFLMMSWTYVNVDMVGACVCAGALCLLFATRTRESVLMRAILPGLLTGLAVGSKYYLGLIGLPFALVILGSDRRKRWRFAALIVLSTVAGFVLSSPYSAIDPQFFVEQVRIELDHYSSGHRGAQAEPGLQQLTYYLWSTWSEFGWAGSLAGLVGIVAGLRSRPRATVLLLAFPVALLLFLSTQRVNFIRNFLAAYTLFPIFIAFGLLVIQRVAVARLRLDGRLAGILIAVVLLAGIPRARLVNKYSAAPDSRNQAVHWIKENVAHGSTLLVAVELMLDTRELDPHYDVRVDSLVSLLVLSPNDRPDRAVFVVPAIEKGSRIDEYFGRGVTRGLRRMEQKFRAGTIEMPRKASHLLHLGNPALEIRIPTDP